MLRVYNALLGNTSKYGEIRVLIDVDEVCVVFFQCWDEPHFDSERGKRRFEECYNDLRGNGV